MGKIITAALLLVIITFLGCKKDNVTDASSNGNIPVIANTSNALAFTLAANSYTANTEYDLTFTTDSLACSIIISNQTLGSASLTIVDSNNSVVYSNAQLSNQVFAYTQANKGIPRKIKINFSNYTGSFSFALAKSGKS